MKDLFIYYYYQLMINLFSFSIRFSVFRSRFHIFTILFTSTIAIMLPTNLCYFPGMEIPLCADSCNDTLQQICYFPGMEIPLCADSCTDTLHQHYHCPLCGKNSFSNMGSMVTHLWRCRDRRKHRRGPVGSQTGGSRLRGANRGPPLRETLADTVTAV